MTRFLLVTHAETDWNVQGRFLGHAEIALNENGRRQAVILRQQLAEHRIETIVASDLCRARETAEILAGPHGVGVTTDRRLRELNFGDWEGLTYAEIHQRDPVALAGWQGNAMALSPPGGERLNELESRLRGFLQDWSGRGGPARARLNHAAGAAFSNTLIVAHRGSLRAMLCLLHDMPVARHWEFQLGMASVTEVEVD